MKHAKRILTLMVFFIASAARSQLPSTDWSWTFQRWGVTCGLLFEDSGLTDSVKAAIRDDICRVYDLFVARSNLFTRVYSPDDPDYGAFVGVDGLQGDNGCPYELNGWDYKLHDGRKYFYVDAELLSKYNEKIALTNNHRSAAAGLNNFLATVNNVTTTNVVMSEYVQHWWVDKHNRPLSVAGFPNPGDFTGFVASFCDKEMLAPSILEFFIGTGRLDGDLCYDVIRRNKHNGDYDYSHAFPLVFKKGRWRIAMPFYDGDL